MSGGWCCPCGVLVPALDLLPDVLFGGVGERLDLVSPGSIDSVGLGARGAVGVAKTSTGAGSFCPLSPSSSRQGALPSCCGGTGGRAASSRLFPFGAGVACTGAGAGSDACRRRRGRRSPGGGGDGLRGRWPDSFIALGAVTWWRTGSAAVFKRGSVLRRG
jgi:hypothetical protein